MTAFARHSVGEITESVDYGVTASATEIAEGPKFLRITDIQDNNVNWDSVPWCECGEMERSEAHLRSGDIVFARTGATTGKSFLIRKCPADAVFASYLIRVRVKDDVEPSYVSHFFQTEDYWSQITKGARGAAQPGVNASTLKALKIPLPPLPEQRRIAAILDQADALRAKRREALAQLDSLTQSIFIEMFGDPATNPKGWRPSKLGELIHSTSDGPHVSPSYAEHGVPFLSARHVRPGQISWHDLKYLSREDAEVQWKKCKPSRGDILYTKGGTTGFAAVVKTDEEFAIWVHIALLKPNQQVVESTWLEAMLNTEYCYRQSQELTHGIANRDLGLKRMVNILMYHPPLNLQQEFAQRMTQLAEQLLLQQSGVVELDNLFASLQYRAFRGEL